MTIAAKTNTKTTVKEAASVAFQLMNMQFTAMEFINEVRDLTGRELLMDSTILRKLRELRQEAPWSFGYKCIDHDKAIYLKSL